MYKLRLLRLKVIEFYDKYGTEATKAALRVSKTPIYKERPLEIVVSLNHLYLS
ncbi:MAG: hypothetical protein NZ530_00695 [Thermodesulfobacteriaceae bacterium]|nr:hypothetical protein [Thermodesulfobacteriaceae bacterium]MCX8040884.1 hypothetical protein [Thermodesulfobacteriaceae bacterium]MDW8135221.1 hypothetical protein [Thermodesulfobacterium sp.]